MKILKEQYDKLFDPKITHREYLNIITAIKNRVEEVWKEILKIQKRKVQWWDFDNEKEDSSGYFDEHRYRDVISLTGVFEETDWNCPYATEFPTSFLWDDNFNIIVQEDYDTFLKEKEEKKKRAKENRVKAKEKKEKIRKNIESKLTSEELKYIKFK